MLPVVGVVDRARRHPCIAAGDGADIASAVEVDQLCDGFDPAEAHGFTAHAAQGVELEAMRPGAEVGPALRVETAISHLREQGLSGAVAPEHARGQTEPVVLVAKIERRAVGERKQGTFDLPRGRVLECDLTGIGKRHPERGRQVERPSLEHPLAHGVVFTADRAPGQLDAREAADAVETLVVDVGFEPDPELAPLAR